VIEAGPEGIPSKVELDEFEKRLEEAKGNVQSLAGRAYFEGPFSKQFYPTFGPRLSECMQQTADTAPADFDLVLDLGADGHVVEAMVRPETKLTTCFTAVVRKDLFPPPPAAGFRVPITMTFTKEVTSPFVPETRPARDPAVE
jgi:hypothetical protein